jgi:hypothetical protein
MKIEHYLLTSHLQKFTGDALMIVRSICVALKTLVFVPLCCVILKAHRNSKIGYYYTWAPNGAGVFFAGGVFFFFYNAVWRAKWGGHPPIGLSLLVL